MIAIRRHEKPMVAFHVRHMTCSQSAGVVAAAVKAIDRGARVRVDLPMRRIEIEPVSAEPADFMDVIGKAGYFAVRQWPSELLHV